MTVKRLHSVNKKATGYPGGGGVHPLHPPLDLPLLYIFKLFINTILVLFGEGELNREGGGALISRGYLICLILRVLA